MRQVLVPYAEKVVERTRRPRVELIEVEGKRQWAFEPPTITLQKFRTRWEGVPQAPVQGEREKARRRRQILAGRIPQDQLFKGDYVAAVNIAGSFAPPKTKERGLIARLLGRAA